MRRFLLACLCALVLVPTHGALAQGRTGIGTGRLLTNDFLGDNGDRWRSGGYVVSKVRGPAWTGVLPGRMGDILEFRFRSEIIAPANIVTAAPGDRRYAGILSFGLHSHFQTGPAEISLGADLVVTGPQTGLGRFQTEAHKVFGAPVPGVLGNQIGNGVHPTATFEAGHSFHLGAARLRPFVELQAGAETLARVGADLHFGGLGNGELMIRDVTTGHLYRGSAAAHTGLTAILGADVAHVAHSVYLPASDGYVLTDTRTRLRAGLHWQGKRNAVFYGLTWLGREFQAQPEGQLTGSIRLDIRF